MKKNRLTGIPEEVFLSLLRIMDEDGARLWLRKRHPKLQGKSPINAMKSKGGKERVLDLIGAISHGFPA